MKQRLLLTASIMFCCVVNSAYAQWYEVTDRQTSADGKLLWCNYNYKSIDERGEEIILSAYLQCGSSDNVEAGFVAEPLDQMVLAHHFTLFDPKDAPTSEKAASLDISMAGNQLFVVPDYQGFGSSVDRDQLYLIFDLSARQCYDALEAGKKVFDEEANVKLHDDWGLYLTGASQGAANAVATQRYMEQQNLDLQWRLKQTLVADGPYCPSAMLDAYMYDAAYQQPLLPMVLPLTLRALWIAYPEEFTAYSFIDCFTQSFQQAIQELMMGGNADEISERLLADGPMDISAILSPEVLDKESALQKTIKACLEKNDLDKDWTPTHPIAGYACSNDDVIPNINNTRMAEAFGTQYFKASDYKMYVSLAYAYAQQTGVSVDNTHQFCCGLFLGYGSILGGLVPYLAKMIPVQPAMGIDAIQSVSTEECLRDLYGRQIAPSRQGFSVKNGRIVLMR